jgi:hypothetical protein
MKRILVTAVLLIVLISPVSSDVGIGIKWFTESESVNQGEQKCISYGIYNPFDTEVNGYLEATKGLEKIFSAEEAKIIPAHTSSTNFVPTQICFNIPRVYQEDSFYGYFTQRECSEKEVILAGEVVAAYKLNSGSGTGSATGASFAAPLKLKVACTPLKRDLTPVYVFAALIIAIALVYLKKRRSS